MYNIYEQINVEEIRSLIKKLEVINSRVVRDLRKLNRRIDIRKVNMMIVAESRVVHQGEGLRRFFLCVGDYGGIVNPNPSQQDSGKIQETIPT